MQPDPKRDRLVRRIDHLRNKVTVERRSLAARAERAEAHAKELAQVELELQTLDEARAAQAAAEAEPASEAEPDGD
jgi:hypothetical protein